MKRKMAVLLGIMVATALFQVHAQEQSRYMGGEVSLEKAPNGALVNAEVLKVSPNILYLEPTTEKVAEGKVKLTKGTPEEVAAVFDLFDKFVPGKNYKIPPLKADTTREVAQATQSRYLG